MNNTTRYTYDARGNRLTAVDASSRTTSFAYDVHNYLLMVTDPAGVTTLTYDTAGNVAHYKDPENHVTRFKYNGLNKVTKVTEPRQNVTTYAYDAAGNIQSITDANGKTTQYAHNYNGRVTRITDALGNKTDFTYGTGCQPCGTGVDQLTSLTDPRGHITVFEYDLAGRLAAEYNPLGHFKTYAYDAAGNVASMTNENNHTTHYLYDPLNRMTQAVYPDGTTKTFSFSARGKMTTAANANLGYAFTYDNNDRITAVTRSDGRNVSYQYNAVNGRSSMTSPDGRTIGYSYDTANRLYQITSDAGAFVFTYDAAGRRTGLAHPNGVSTAYNYDASNSLTKILARSGKRNTIDSFAYTYDNTGNRTSLTDLAGLHSYTYDDTYQLVTASHPDSTELYAYDPAGNRSNTVADPDNALAEDAYYTYSYDYNGNLLQKVSKSSGTTTTYTYDYDNRLVQVAFPGTTAQYSYDALGRRIEKNVNGAITQYVYDGANIVTEYDGSGNVKAKYTHNLTLDDPLAVQQGSDTFYYHKDGLGSVTDLTDASGKVIKRYRYRGFGEIYSESGTLVQPYIFTGRENDPETGLYYYRARYYDPRAGRFITKDPIRFAAGDVNLYRYVQNNPVNFIDPDGLSPVGWVIKLTKTGYKKICSLGSTTEARTARRQGEDVLARDRQMAKAIEKGSFGGQDIMRHRGHGLPDGSTGRPHFQTSGEPGHTFWGSMLGILGGLLDPFDAISGELASDEDYMSGYGSDARPTLCDNTCGD
jgi:RHS repeat-associated protein